MGNTGRKIYPWLIQVDDSGNPTGLRKPNVPSDPDYIPPYADYVDCPLPTTTTTTTSSTTTTTTAAPTTTTTTAAPTTTTTTAAPTTTTTTAAPTTTTTTLAPTTTTTTAAPTTTTTTTISTTTTTTTIPTTLWEVANQKSFGNTQLITDVQVGGITIGPMTGHNFPIAATFSGSVTRPEYGTALSVEVFYDFANPGDTVSIIDSHSVVQSFVISIPGAGSHVFTGVAVTGTGVIVRLF